MKRTLLALVLAAGSLAACGDDPHKGEHCVEHTTVVHHYPASTSTQTVGTGSHKTKIKTVQPARTTTEHPCTRWEKDDSGSPSA